MFRLIVIKTIKKLYSKTKILERGFFCGPGGTRTHMPFERSILSAVRIPIPPLDHTNLIWRSGWDSHPRIAVLQTAVLTTSPPDHYFRYKIILTK